MLYHHFIIWEERNSIHVILSLSRLRGILYLGKSLLKELGMESERDSLWEVWGREELVFIRNWWFSL